ncbi:hypothetical protein LOC71_00130 [Rhodopirellula sp. JC740]|uniref:Uncharacterized protein n=1 Tax=Rhodopirellula halodulae TaxID=2894198 RepID=A0ABS8NCU6_9BACT|nr:hypothetical protein [Rhodopirellula sp. JC740]MCC9640663.1 hypothetical protein [Rhodopirellula sp. JC740]
MFLIAVDEAGYGPKLGPLVVAATRWDGPVDSEEWSDDTANRFDLLKTPVRIDGQRIVIDDSKKVFQSRTQRRGDSSPLGNLHRALSFAHHAMQRPESTWQQRLPTLIPDDIEQLSAIPWLSGMRQATNWPTDLPTKWLSRETVEPAIQAWQVPDWCLHEARARLVTAKAFNAFCEPCPDTGRAANKSDLLGETSLNLVASMLRDPALKQHRHGQIFFDRHGGRRYYAGVLSATFPDANIRVVQETNRCSSYDVRLDDQTLRMHFTVKGDSFAPVALSSLHAKCLREIAMTFFNDYFQRHWSGDIPFQPTAGYPVDADRFLVAAEHTCRQQSISPSDLVRTR